MFMIENHVLSEGLNMYTAKPDIISVTEGTHTHYPAVLNATRMTYTYFYLD